MHDGKRSVADLMARRDTGVSTAGGGWWRSDALLMFLVCAAAGVLLVLGSLQAPFYWDDLHLIRTHTSSELAAAWSGSYEADSLSPPSFRPLSMYFEHARAAAFGDSVAAHRLFLVALFAAFLTLAGMLAREMFAIGRWQMLLGGLLGLTHVDNVTHYLWPTDGIFLASSILVLAALLAFVMALRSGSIRWLAVCAACAALALLTREDTLVVFPVLVWLGAILVLPAAPARSRRVLPWPTLAVFGFTLCAVLASFWFWRAAAVPDAYSPRMDMGALLWAWSHIVQNAGTYDRLLIPWPRVELIIAAWFAWLAAAAAAAVLWLDRPARLAVLCWTGAVLISAAPAMVVARANLFLVPTAFWGLLLAQVLTSAWTHARRVSWRVVIVGLMLMGVVLPAFVDGLVQQELRPNNLQWMCRNALIVYNPEVVGVLPPERVAAVQEELERFGITGPDHLGRRWRALEQQARRDGRFGIGQDEQPFIPAFELLPHFRLHPRCEPPG